MPKKKIGKHLQFYLHCMCNGGVMPSTISIYQGGLCSMADNNLIDKKIFKLFSENQGKYSYWADDEIDCIIDCHQRRYLFTKLRQTIVLFMACLNGEL